MTTMSIHSDDAFAEALRNYAAKMGKSVNQTVKDVFSPILGLTTETGEKTNPWSRFVGALPDIDCERWDKAVDSVRVVDEELWK